MNYSYSFDRDFNWYLSMRKKFDFDGSSEYFKKTVQIFRRRLETIEYEILNEISFASFKEQFPNMAGDNSIEQYSNGMFYEYSFVPIVHPIIIYNKEGVNGKEAFYQWDSNGKIVPTKHPNILFTLLKTKGSVNLHIKMYAEDRARGLFPYIEFRAFCIKYKCPSWFREAVENQKCKYYDSR